MLICFLTSFLSLQSCLTIDNLLAFVLLLHCDCLKVGALSLLSFAHSSSIASPCISLLFSSLPSLVLFSSTPMLLFLPFSHLSSVCTYMSVALWAPDPLHSSSDFWNAQTPKVTFKVFESMSSSLEFTSPFSYVGFYVHRLLMATCNPQSSIFDRLASLPGTTPSLNIPYFWGLSASSQICVKVNPFNFKGKGKHCGSELVGCLWLMEISNPFMHMREIFKELGYKDSNLSLMNDISFALIFTVARLIIGPYVTFVTLRANNPFIIKATAFGLQVVSIFWFYKIARMVYYKMSQRKKAYKRF
eukprot:Gb_16011 [translate_table: standard]